MRRRPALSVTLLVLALAAAAGWSHWAGGWSASAAQEKTQEKAQDAVHPALTVTVAPPVQRIVASAIAASGNVAAWQEASIGAQVQGLRLEQVNVNVGDVVRAGQVLATLAQDTVQADVAQAQAALAQARAAEAEARANAERAQALAGTGAMSAQQIAQYATAGQTAQAQVQVARAQLQAQQLRLGHTRVLAPDAGVISARSATVGAVVGTGTELFRMVLRSRLEWRAEVNAADLARLAPGGGARLQLPGGEAVAGTVRMLAPTVDAATRNALVYVDLPRHAQLRAGQYLSGELLLGEHAALTVPLAALVVRDGFTAVFVLQGGDGVALRRVRTASRGGDWVEVVDGLQPDERVVQQGGAFLNDGDRVRVVAAAQEVQP